jgi:hypothetical protein
VEHVHQEGRTLSILVSRNVEAVAEQARSFTWHHGRMFSRHTTGIVLQSREGEYGMLWMKGWLETRWRLFFTLAVILGVQFFRFVGAPYGMGVSSQEDANRM